MARLRRWELRACARHGHATYAPTEPALAGRLSGTTGVGEVWRCLRCSDFVLGPPHARGPADEAPLALRGAYAALEAIEGVGLWLLKRWGEYFAAVATAIFLPLEVRELIKGVTFTRAGAFAINVAAVIYLLLAKRLFGLRGGRAAYDQERHGDSLLEVEAAAAAEPEQRPATIGSASARR